MVFLDVKDGVVEDDEGEDEEDGEGDGKAPARKRAVCGWHSGG